MTQSFRFGRFELRPSQRVLLVDGEPAALGSRAFDLLSMLLAHRDRVVGKNELFETVWPGVVVEDNNLAVQVSALRRLIGPQAVVTIPGRGYRFVAPTADDGAAAAAPAASAAAAASLPQCGDGLVGRDDDQAALLGMLGECRFVSVVGAGGVGKTSLALAAAHARCSAHRDGACWVDLADVEGAAALPAAIASATGLGVGTGDDAMVSLIELLRAKQMLIVLDGAEHLIDAVSSFVVGVLGITAAVQLLVTSQAPLHARGESLLRLEPLSLPRLGDSVDAALAHGAVALWVKHARAGDRRFTVSGDNVEAVIALCRGLDGNPLAIRLAAARLPLLGVHELARRLGDRLHLLRDVGGGLPARQQTLHAALDWSHGLLRAGEQRVLRRLAVFVGGFSLEAVGGVAGTVAADSGDPDWAAIDSLGELVDRSLVHAETGVRPRYRLLDAVRSYAHARLVAADEVHAIQHRHAAAYAALFDAAYESYWASADAAWLDAHAPEIDNLRAALEWSAANEPALALRLASAAGVLYMLVGRAAEARAWFAALEPHAEAATAGVATARYWLERSRLHWGVSKAAMLTGARRAVADHRLAADSRGVYLALRCIVGSDASDCSDGGADEADQALADMARLEQANWPPRLRAQRLLAELGLLRVRGQFDDAQHSGQQLLALAENAGLDSVAAAAMAGLAQVSLALGRPDDALAVARRLLATADARRGNFALPALMSVAEAQLALGHVDAARQAVAEFLTLSRSRNWEWMAMHAAGFAALAVAEGRLPAAARINGYADAAAARTGRPDGAAAARRSATRDAVLSTLDLAAVARLEREGALLDDADVAALVLAR